jgi:uncharacterized protein GlcG (DUF336 family)
VCSARAYEEIVDKVVNQDQKIVKVAVCIAVIDRDGKVLITRRAK